MLQNKIEHISWVRNCKCNTISHRKSELTGYSIAEQTFLISFYYKFHQLHIISSTTLQKHRRDNLNCIIYNTTSHNTSRVYITQTISFCHSLLRFLNVSTLLHYQLDWYKRSCYYSEPVSLSAVDLSASDPHFSWTSILQKPNLKTRIGYHFRKRIKYLSKGHRHYYSAKHHSIAFKKHYINAACN